MHRQQYWAPAVAAAVYVVAVAVELSAGSSLPVVGLSAVIVVAAAEAVSPGLN